ncbi:coiled-coil domain-containing 92B [Narcine bancroftii]|uniref:coiled-coil domain-containing 92B n=1 Tax=Narcine bancroftii TaxID=1343680 RepID=UPI0038318C86
METSSLERQLQSVLRNVAFLKGEHMDLLHGLHMEILQLQKRCSELTYELTSRTSKSGQSDECRQKEDCNPIEARLREKELQNAALKRELCRKEALISALDESLRRRERLFLEELKRRTHRMAVLSVELQKQSEAAAQLSLQLHSVRQKLSNPRQADRPAVKPSDKAIPTSPVYTSIALRKNHRLHSRAAGITCGNKTLGRDSSRQRHLPGWDPMPDPALFLQAKRLHAKPQHHPPNPPPLMNQDCKFDSLSPMSVPRVTQTASKEGSDLLGPPAETEIPLSDEESNGDMQE